MPCDMDYFLVNLEGDRSTLCKQCLNDRMYCKGGSNIGPKRGYWRMNETGDIFSLCPIAKACDEIDDLGRRVTSGYCT